MPEFTDEGFDPLPALTEPSSPDEELRLQDILASGPPVSVQTDIPVPLGRSAAYDFVEHRLRPSAASGPLMTRGVETLVTRIEKCLRTRRGENPAVDPDFGCDLMPEDLLEQGGPFDASAVAEYAAAARRALIAAHPRITDVTDIVIDGSADSDMVTISFRVPFDDEDQTDDLIINALPIGG